jgi:hypothetical protein
MTFFSLYLLRFYMGKVGQSMIDFDQVGQSMIGYGTEARLIRNNSQYTGIIRSGSGAIEDAEKSQAAGFAVHLSNPMINAKYACNTSQPRIQ